MSCLFFHPRLHAFALMLAALCACTPASMAQVYEKVFSFSDARAEESANTPYSGASPNSVVQGSDGDFYGTTYEGGASNFGTAFKMTRTGVFTTLIQFTGNVGPSKGSRPSGGLLQGSDGNFYGTTQNGGASGMGTVFKMTASGVLTTLVEFTGNGSINKGRSPFAGLLQDSLGNFYGTTYGGGAFDRGTVFKMTQNGLLSTLVEFTGNGTNNKGSTPQSALVQGSDGNFYGTTEGGSSNLGTVFRITPGGVLTTLVEFTGAGTNNRGSHPQDALVLGSDGNFYGTTQTGGIGFVAGISYSGYGTVFKMTPAGVLTTLVELTDSGATNKGRAPSSSLMQASDGNFYGTTSHGGSGFGTIFKMTPAGMLTTLVAFGGTNKGVYPRAHPFLVQGSDGNFYGTTHSGGRTDLNGGNGFGTVFSMTPAGVLKTLVAFAGGSPNKGSKPFAGLAQNTDGNFFGTTFEGGATRAGTVFKMTPGGELTTLVASGSNSLGVLARGIDGSFYGTTLLGGNGYGSVFKMTPAGGLTTLVGFQMPGSSMGWSPRAGVVQGSDGNFYGTTSRGGGDDFGTVFKMTPSGGLLRWWSSQETGRQTRVSTHMLVWYRATMATSMARLPTAEMAMARFLR
ncbi:MAG: hypothetical protein IPK32_09795 [Verrucomicrobiaceae bacterium]|nr:hypothetical protein [Verrucomicrobiaceae bacterium]